MPVALYSEADAYLVEDRAMVGRRAAGTAMLRAAVEGRGNEPIILYGGSKQSADKIVAAVRAIDPKALAQWIPPTRSDLLGKVGTMFRPDPALAIDARLRLRGDVSAYSLCGITHTLSSTRAQQVITDYITEPMMPWDALICTSSAALDVVENLIGSAVDYQRWRLGLQQPPPLPQFPVIPLGVHTDDFATDDRKRRAARTLLELADDEVALLYAGRLSLSTKAHPYPMLVAAEEVARRTGRRIVLMQAGQFYTASADQTIRGATARYAPSVRHLFVDGGLRDHYAAAYRGADIFMSLSDNIQETFGITPVEAMASGLPVLVSDWNGYKDTVRDGVDGFRIPTWAARSGAGDVFARRLELGEQYETYCARAASAVSIDQKQLIDRLTTLVENPELRRTMGDAGRRHAREDLDWRVVYRRYRSLWADLADRRTKAALGLGNHGAIRTGVPKAFPSQDDPYRIFAHYQTSTIGPDTIAILSPGADGTALRAIANDLIFSYLDIPIETAERVIATLAEPRSVAEIATTLELDVDATILLVGQLAKMLLLSLESPST